MNYGGKGEGVTPIRKICCKKCNIVFRNEGRGAQRPVGVFPKIHPNPHARSSLMERTWSYTPGYRTI